MMQPSLHNPRRRTGNRLGMVCIAIALWVAAGAARAGAALPCTEPKLFQGALVNSLVLPYRFVGTQSTPEIRRASRQIAALVHLEVLFSMLKYGRVGGTDLLEVSGRTCDVDEVIDQVTRGGGPGSLPRGHTLVVVWGRLFEERDQLYVQTYVRFLRQGNVTPVRETIRIPLYSENARLDLVAELPAQSIAFPPRRISKQDLARVEREFRESMVVRPTKSLDAPGRSIDFAPEQPFPYGVTKVEGDWMWIEPMMGGPSGWVRARIGGAPEDWSLRRWLPELAYIDAINGFMRLQVMNGSAVDRDLRTRLHGWIENGFGRFEQTVSSNDAPAAYGLASAVRGFMLWASRTDAKARAEAATLFGQARTLMPEYAAARNLAAVTQPFRSEGPFNAEVLTRLGRELVGAVALDPSDAIALGNLDRVYRLFESHPPLSPYSTDELKQRLAVVQSARAKAVPEH